MKLDHDLHVHTYLSACCTDKEEHTPENIIALAEEMNIKTIGFSDHVWQNPHYQPNNWYKPQDESQIVKLREILNLDSAVDVNTDVQCFCLQWFEHG